jgi:ssDNA-binding Zn-finger/Zn-ribbon topoisomerase 1
MGPIDNEALNCPECDNYLMKYEYDGKIYWCCQNVNCGYEEVEID